MYVCNFNTNHYNIVVNTRDQLTKVIDEECKKVYRNKIKIMEIYDNNTKIDDAKLTYVLEEDTPKYLNQTNAVVDKFLHIIRKRRDIITKILQKCRTSEEKASVASLLTNNFYENIFSSAFIEKELLVILYLSLKNEIFELQNPNVPQAFLKETINSYLFRGLLRKDDIKSYFGIVLKDLLEKMENKEESTELNFEIGKIISEIIKYQTEKQSTGPKLKRAAQLKEHQSKNSTCSQINFLDPSHKSSNEKKENEMFNLCIIDLSKNELIDKLKEEKNEKMKEYYNNQIIQFEIDDTIFQNQTFLLSLYKCQNSDIVYKVYQHNFNIMVELIKLLIDNFMDNVHIIPYSIKCSCKIISILIRKKFPNISLIEHNNFISEFFFEKMLKPIFTIPDYNGLISSVVVSNITKKNIILLQKILKQLVNGGFYKATIQPDFTVFNRFFIGIMPKVFDFYDKLIDVQLPPVLEKIINNQTDDSYNIYDYFNDNPNEKIAHSSICFTIDDVITLYKIINENEKDFLNITFNIKEQEKLEKIKKTQEIFKITYEKFKSLKLYMEFLNDQREEDLSNKRKTFVVFSELIFSSKFKKIMTISTKNQNYTIPLPKTPKTPTPGENPLPPSTQSSIQAINLINAKNYISKILFNFKDLTEEFLLSSSIKTTEEIFNSIRIFLQTDYYLLLYSIPLDWYGMSLISIHKDIPKEYIENDYSKFYEEFTNEVSEAIALLDIRTLSGIKTKLKYTSRAIKNMKDCLSILRQIDLNNKIQRFLEHLRFNLEMILDSSQKNKVLTVKNRLEKVPKGFMNFISDSKEPKGEICTTINDFITSFPHFVNYQTKHNVEIKALFQAYKVPEAINTFLDLINSNIKDYFKDASNEEMNKIKMEINNHLMKKLYVKLFPKDQDYEDIKIYQRCYLLSWVEPKHIIPSKNIILNNFVEETTKYINKMQQERTPLKKLEALSKVFQIIQSTLTFSTADSETSVDDTLPLLEYAMIKAAPKMLATNLQYMEFFLNPLFAKQEYGMHLSELYIVVRVIKEFDHTKLINVSSEEYERYHYFIF